MYVMHSNTKVEKLRVEIFLQPKAMCSHSVLVSMSPPLLLST